MRVPTENPFTVAAHPAASPMILPAALAALESIVLGKREALQLALTCLLARGHLLIEDVPGVGKTTLAHALAQVLGLAWQRVQFTSDLLPADILGVSIFDRATQRFEFRPGPVFTQLLLADEVNRASPRTQSALLEAMEERQVSADGQTHALPQPFFVVATQNPAEQLGTYPLPESQLDRFLLKIALGYPDARHERLLLSQPDRREALTQLSPAMTANQLLSLQQQARQVKLASPLLDYAQALIAATRSDRELRLGLSPRAAQGLLRAAQAHALVQDRHAVLPDDIQAVWPAVAGHRLQPRDANADSAKPAIARRILQSVAVPI